LPGCCIPNLVSSQASGNARGLCTCCSSAAANCVWLWPCLVRIRFFAPWRPAACDDTLLPCPVVLHCAHAGSGGGPGRPGTHLTIGAACTPCTHSTCQARGHTQWSALNAVNSTARAPTTTQVDVMQQQQQQGRSSGCLVAGAKCCVVTSSARAQGGGLLQFA
jgi:hypothetical protein